MATRDVPPSLDTLYSAFEMSSQGSPSTPTVGGSGYRVHAIAEQILQYQDIGGGCLSICAADQEPLGLQGDEDSWLLPAFLAPGGGAPAGQVDLSRISRSSPLGTWNMDRIYINSPANVHWCSDKALRRCRNMCEVRCGNTCIWSRRRIKKYAAPGRTTAAEYLEPRTPRTPRDHREGFWLTEGMSACRRHRR
jgi:hypothetical protein